MNEEDRRVASKMKLAKNVYFVRGLGVKKKCVEKSREQVRAQLSESDSFVIAFVGELSKRKNQEMLISAMPDIIKEIPNAILWLVGDGNEKYKLEKLADKTARGRIKFLGRRENVADIINAADIYVSASLVEGLPFNIAEALSLRKTVVASEIKGHTDLIENGKNGYLFNPKSKTSLVNAVKNAYTNENALSDLEIYNAYERVSFDEVFSQTYSVIKSALFD